METRARLATSRMLTADRLRLEPLFLVVDIPEAPILRFPAVPETNFSDRTIVTCLNLRDFCDQDRRVADCTERCFPIFRKRFPEFSGHFGRNRHGADGSAADDSGMRLTPGGDLQPMLEQGNNRGQAFFCAAAAAGQVHDERAAAQPGYGPREPRELILPRTIGAHGLGQPRSFAINDAAGGLGSAVAR